MQERSGKGQIACLRLLEVPSFDWSTSFQGHFSLHPTVQNISLTQPVDGIRWMSSVAASLNPRVPDPTAPTTNHDPGSFPRRRLRGATWINPLQHSVKYGVVSATFTFSFASPTSGLSPSTSKSQNFDG